MSELLIPNDSYVSVEFANAYHLQRGNLSWTELSDEQKAQRLVQASDYVDVAYQYKGLPLNINQVRAFPRNKQLTVPLKVKWATCELALQENLTATPEPIKTAVKVGDLSVSYAQQGSANQVENQRFPYVASLLSEYCSHSKQVHFASLARG